MEGLVERLDPRFLLQKIVGFLPDLALAIVILMATGLAYRLSRPPLEAALRRAGFHDALIEMLVRNLYRFVVFIFGLVMAADQLGVNVGAALAGIGVAGIAIGLAAQDSLANTVAGFLIFWDKPFAVNDWVSVAGQYGRVAQITMRSTRIRTNQNTFVVIPNRKIIDEVLVNHSAHGVTRIDVRVSIAYEQELEVARETLLEAVRGVQGVIAEPAPEVVVTDLSPSSLDLHVRVWIEDASREQAVRVQVAETAKLALDRAGIRIPLPQLTLSLDRVADDVWNRLGGLSGKGGSAAEKT